MTWPLNFGTEMDSIDLCTTRLGLIILLDKVDSQGMVQNDHSNNELRVHTKGVMQPHAS